MSRKRRAREIKRKPTGRVLSSEGRPTTKSNSPKECPSRAPSQRQIAPGTPCVPDAWWPFYDGSANEATRWDDPVWGAVASQFVRIGMSCLASDWLMPRTKAWIRYWSETERAIRLAMIRVHHCATLRLSPDEQDRIEEGHAAINAAFAHYTRTCNEIRMAGGDAAPDEVDIRMQSAVLWVRKDSLPLARLLEAVANANPFRDPAIDRMIREGGVLYRLETKLWHAAKEDERNDPPPPKTPDDGQPFYKPSHFATWNIGDELLRRNANDQQSYIEGRVRRIPKKPLSGTGKRPVYWYSESDARKQWPDRFVVPERQPTKP
jgi:hypothetical protein